MIFPIFSNYQQQKNSDSKILNYDKRKSSFLKDKRISSIFRERRRSSILKEKRNSFFLKEKKKPSISREKPKSNNIRKDYRKSLELYKPRFSKLLLYKNERKKVSLKNSSITYDQNNRLNYSQITRNDSFNNSHLNYKEIEKDIQYVILEMKNNALLEIKRQSCDEFELYKNRKKKHGLKNEESDIESIKNGEQKNKKEKRQYKKSKTNIGNDVKKIFKKNKNKDKENNIKGNESNNKLNVKNNINETKIGKNNKNGENKPFSEKFRFYGRGGVIEDSYNESESDEEYEVDNFLINPETTVFLIYDTIILFSAIYALIFIPYEITNNLFCYMNKMSKNFIDFFLDILFFIDLIINFFLEYYSKKDKLIQNWKKIINNYLKGWFFFDLLSALPFNIIYYYYCEHFPNLICHTYEKNIFIYYIVLLKCLKSIKIFKMAARKKNQLISRIIEDISENPSYEHVVSLTTQILLVIFGFHILSCIHIFIGKYTYPGWIYSNEFQNYSLSNLYMISIYYLITTMTTVGYGDISSDSFIEIVFRIILLAVGIICYSWLISSISNGINKQSYASMNYESDCKHLEIIRMEHTELPFKLYSDIKNYLEVKHFRQNIYDKNLLINSLPYSLKNNLIFSMYKMELKYFNFFKGISNANFLSEILYNFSSIINKKNDVLLNENEIIDQIFFVNEGRLSLELPIDMNNLEYSINEYFNKEFMNYAFNFENNDDFKFIESDISNRSISSLFEEKIEYHDKTKDNKSNLNDSNISYLKIYDIHKNEDYGISYMLQGKRSPFSLKVRTKIAKLYTIKGDDFSNLSENYKNIIKRINKKEKKLIKMIKNSLIKTLDRFCDLNGIKIHEIYKDSIIKEIEQNNKNMLPDNQKNTSISKNRLNYIDEEINKTIREFSSKIRTFKRTTIKANVNDNNIGDSKNTTMPKSTKEIGSTIKNKNIKRIKSTFNLDNKKDKGEKVFQGFKPQYIAEYYSSKNARTLNNQKIHKILNIGDEKKNIPLKEIKTKITTNVESNNTLEGYEFNYSGSEETIKTVEINQNEEKSTDEWPKTLEDLPPSLKNKIKNTINFNNIKHINTKYTIEHINIEIKNNNNTINNSYNDDNNKNKSTLRSFNGNNNITINEYLDYSNLNKSNENEISSNNIKPQQEKQKNINFTTKMQNKLNKIKVKKTTYEKYSTKNTSRLTLSPIYASNIFSQTIRGTGNLSPSFSNYKRTSITHNAIIKKNEEFNSFSNNLFSTSPSSFVIKSSYKNINQASGWEYIKDKKFQANTIKFIKGYKSNKKLKNIKTRLTAKLDLQKMVKGNNEEDNFKKIENNIRTVKTRMTNYIKKKKKEKEKKNMYKSIKTNVTLSQKDINKKKLTKKQLSLGNKIENTKFNSSTSMLNSLNMNPNETLAKLNCSNNDLKIDLIENKIELPNENIFFNQIIK